MAEMYADLMELNDRLHRNLVEKDCTISTLVQSLRSANMEVPVQDMRDTLTQCLYL